MPPDFSVVAIIAAYNEADIIEQVVGDLIDQGIHVYFLDDNSTDCTVAAVERFVGRGVLAIERLADTLKDPAPEGFEWERILLRKTRLATQLDADWFIHHDADEFRESPWPHLSLKDAIRTVDALGFNAIDFTGLDFWPVHDRFRAGGDVREAFTFYSEPAPYDRLQIRAWKKTGDLDLASSAGHEARFHGRRIFPLRFILRHYPIRGQTHGERKVFRERRDRFLERERARGWHVQYDDMEEGASFIRDPSTLARYDPDAVRVALTLRHRDVEALERSLGEVRSLVETQCRELESSREELARTHAELGARSAEVSALREQLERITTALAETRVQLDARIAELAERNADLAARNADLTARDAELAKRTSERDARVAELAAQAAELEGRTLELHTRSVELEAHRAEMARLRDAVEQRAAEIERWRASLEDGTRRLDAIHRSLSWRWTSAARTAYRLLKRT